MKTTWNISPKFPIRHELVKEIARFCISQAKPVAKYRGLKIPAHIHFRMFGSPRKTRSGRATRNHCKLTPHQNIRVFVRMGTGYGLHSERYHRYADSPLCTCDGTVETYVHLIAHELGHGICGYDGLKVGEFQCENFAAKCLDAWRSANQDPACMI